MPSTLDIETQNKIDFILKEFEERGVTIYKAAKEVNLPIPTISNFFKRVSSDAKYRPQISTIDKLYHYFKGDSLISVEKEKIEAHFKTLEKQKEGIENMIKYWENML